MSLASRSPAHRAGSRGAPPLEIGQALTLRVARPDGERALSARLEALDRPTRRLVVAWPVEERRLFPFRPGQRLGIEVAAPEDAAYVAPATLVAATVEEPPHLVLELARPWHRTQRRRDVRLGLDVRPSLARRIVDGAWLAVHVRITDLSAGGLRLHSDDELVEGDELDLAFSLPDGGSDLRVRARVRHVGRASSTALEGWRVGCELHALHETARDRIAQFICARQRVEARRRRGLDEPPGARR